MGRHEGVRVERLNGVCPSNWKEVSRRAEKG